MPGEAPVAPPTETEAPDTDPPEDEEPEPPEPEPAEPEGAPDQDRPSESKRPELRAAVRYLNEVRANPAAYDEQMVADFNAYFDRNVTIDLSDVEPSHALVWHDTLAQVAQAKCDDMFARGYWHHVDPDGEGINIKMHRAGYRLRAFDYANPANNFYESLHRVWEYHPAGFSTPTAATLEQWAILDIQALIIDDGVPSLGHRIHLLGMDEWHATHTDIGIGLSYRQSGLERVRYMCVIIAHEETD